MQQSIQASASRRIHPRPFARARTSDVQHLNVVGCQPVPERCRFDAFLQRHDQAGLADLAGVRHGEGRPAVQLAQVQDQRAVRVLDIAPGAGLMLGLPLHVGHPQKTIANDLKLIANIPDVPRRWRPLISDGPLSDASKSLDYRRSP